MNDGRKRRIKHKDRFYIVLFLTVGIMVVALAVAFVIGERERTSTGAELRAPAATLWTKTPAGQHAAPTARATSSGVTRGNDLFDKPVSTLISTRVWPYGKITHRDE